jgi:hypothetical protein
MFCHLEYCSKFFEKSSKFFEKSSKFFEKSSTTYYLKLLNFGIISLYEIILIYLFTRKWDIDEKCDFIYAHN